MTRGAGGLLIAIGLTVACAVGALAQDAPRSGRPITLIVPFAAGGPTDVVARIAADAMTARLGRTIVVENVAGAGGATGALRAARAPANGDVIFLGQMGTHALGPALSDDLPHRPIEDFAPIGLVASAPMALVARQGVDARSLDAFAAWARANAGRASHAHAGVGATSQVACLLLNQRFGIHSASVAYRGTAPALNDVVAGQIDYLCDQVTNVAAQVRAGTVQGVAIFSRARSPAAPDLPTAAEQGYPDLEIVVWNGLFAPAGTPPAIIEAYSAALSAALDDPAAARRFADLGAVTPDADERGPEPFARLVAREMARWRGVLRGEEGRRP